MLVFFFNDTATAEIYTLSLHDALPIFGQLRLDLASLLRQAGDGRVERRRAHVAQDQVGDRKSTRLNSSHVEISYAVFCLKKKKPEDDFANHGCRAPRVHRDLFALACQL